MSIPEEIQRRLVQAVTTALESEPSGSRERLLAEFNDWILELGVDDRFERYLGEDYFGPYQRDRPDPEANQRAAILLERFLSVSQTKELLRKGYFHVKVGARKFRILRKPVHNVVEIKNGRISKVYCAIPKETCPIPDVMLAQKLALENQPEIFFSVANVSSPRRRRVTGSMVAAVLPILTEARERFKEERRTRFREQLREAMESGMAAYEARIRESHG